MMEPREMKEKETAQLEKNIFPTGKVKQSDCDSETAPLTTEEFHRLLLENTTMQSAERSRHCGELARIKREYARAIDEIQDKEDSALYDLREARSEWEKAQTLFDDRKRKLARIRNLVGQLLNSSKVEESNLHAANNIRIQSERHLVFARYRNSGGGDSRRKRRTAAPGVEREEERRER